MRIRINTNVLIVAVSLYQIVSTEDGIVEQRIEEIVGGGGDDGKHNCEKKNHYFDLAGDERTIMIAYKMLP